MKRILLAVLMVFLWVGIVCAASNVTFTWDKNLETDLAGYRLHQGITSGVYDSVVADIAVGTETVTLTGIPDGTYYWALIAYDTDNNESGYSNEVTANLDTLAPGSPQTVTITIIIKVE